MLEFAHEQLLYCPDDQRRGPPLSVLVAPQTRSDVRDRVRLRVRHRAAVQRAHAPAQAVEHVSRDARLERLGVQLERDVAELELAAAAASLAFGELPGARRRRQCRHRSGHRAAPHDSIERVAVIRHRLPAFTASLLARPAFSATGRVSSASASASASAGRASGAHIEAPPPAPAQQAKGVAAGAREQRDRYEQLERQAARAVRKRSRAVYFFA